MHRKISALYYSIQNVQTLRNSPWRLLVVYFCPSPVAARHGESAVKAAVLLSDGSVIPFPEADTQNEQFRQSKFILYYAWLRFH
jgi:hypothetical protein